MRVPNSAKYGPRPWEVKPEVWEQSDSELLCDAMMWHDKTKAYAEVLETASNILCASQRPDPNSADAVLALFVFFTKNEVVERALRLVMEMRPDTPLAIDKGERVLIALYITRCMALLNCKSADEVHNIAVEL